MEGQKGCQIHLGNRQCIGTGKALSWRLEHSEESNPIDEIASVRGPGGEGGAPCIERRRVCQPRNRSRSWLPDSEGGAANRVPDGNRWGCYRRGGKLPLEQDLSVAAISVDEEHTIHRWLC